MISTAAALSIGFQGLLGVSLGGRVALMRMLKRIPAGDDEPVLRRAIRAHLNHAEWVPMLCLLLLVLDLQGAPASLVGGFGGALAVARVAHAAGLSQTTSVSLGRRIGASLTWLLGMGLVGAVGWYALVA